MLATELSRLPAPDTVAQDSALSWKQVVASAEPFLHAVATQLGDQIQKFDPEIAGYAEYALTNQGKQLRPALLALSAGAALSSSKRTGNVTLPVTRSVPRDFPADASDPNRSRQSSKTW